MSYRPTTEDETHVMKMLSAFEPDYVKLDKLLCLFASSKHGFEKTIVLKILGSGANGKSVFMKLMQLAVDIRRNPIDQLETVNDKSIIYYSEPGKNETVQLFDIESPHLHVFVSNHTPKLYDNTHIIHQCSTVFKPTLDEITHVGRALKNPETQVVMKKIMDYYSQMNWDIVR